MEFFTWLENSGFATWVREGASSWAYDIFLASHAVGMAAVVGLSGAIALRILGVASGLPLAPMEKFFPFMYAGFWLNAGSGVVLFTAYPVKAVTNPGFYIKIVGVVLAVVCIRRIKLLAFGNRATLDRRLVTKSCKILAGTLLFLWWGTILAGRLMAYHGIANIEWQASVAVVIVTAVLLAGFAAVRLIGRVRSARQEKVTAVRT